MLGTVRAWFANQDITPGAIAAGVVGNASWFAIYTVVNVLFGAVQGWQVALAVWVVGLVFGMVVSARLSRRVQFYEEDDVAPSIVDAIAGSKEAWASWHTATRISVSHVLTRNQAATKLTRVLLNKPKRDGYLRHLAASFDNTTADLLEGDIKRAIQSLRTDGVKEIRVWDGPLLNMVFVNPEEKNLNKSCVHITPMGAFLEAALRPTVIVQAQKHKEAYENLKRSYVAVWEKAEIV
jgi:hypothetical protein